MMVLINFNLIVPTGWQVGLIRVEDVVVGAMVGIVVSVLLWPRGATAAVSKAIEEARAVGAKFLKAAVLRVTRGASEDATDRVIALSHEALRPREQWMTLSGSIFQRAAVRRNCAHPWCGPPTARSGCAPRRS